MMRISIILLSLFLNSPKPLKVAVIDTGFDFRQKNKISLCESGSKDFTGTGLKDNHGHGTNVSGIIEHYANGTAYCQIILKVYDKKEDEFTAYRYTMALKEAIDLDVDVINVSADGSEFLKKEKELYKKALDNGIKIFAAAGNDALDISENKCDVYPACYDNRIIVVGNKKEDGEISDKSNKGDRVNQWEVGVDVESFGLTMSGTSQATAVATGKYIHQAKSNE